MNQTLVKKIALSAMLLALCLVLPFLTGQIPEIGNLLLPMHLPVFLCGFICGPVWGGFIGLVAPFLRSAMFGMPPIYPTATSMAFELLTYGLVSGLIYRLSGKKNLLTVYIALISAMILGRAVWGAVQAILLANSGNPLTFAVFWAQAVVNALPGIAIQVVAIPLILFALGRAHLIPFGENDFSFEARKVAKRAQKIQKDKVIIAIDGKCASGKSTLAAYLSSLLNAEVIKMDSFFLREEQKTPERLEEVGGNIDYERFEEEVIEPLKKGNAFSYRPYDCHKEEIVEPIEVTGAKYIIVEGSYSLHPRFKDIYDLKVFVKVSPKKQEKRILKRNGEERAKRYKDEWIPKEEAYFAKYDIEKSSDIRIKN